MTTLPHTAPIRLPRQTSAGQLPGPNGNGHVTTLAPHGPHAVFPVPHAGGGAAQLTPSDVWRVIRSNLWLIILSLIVFSGAGVAVNQYILKPYFSRYTSTALCRVTTDAKLRGDIDLRGAELSTPAVEQEANNQASMLRHESLLIEVLSDPNSKIRQTRWWAECGGNVEVAKEELMDHFSVAPIPDSGLIAVLGVIDAIRAAQLETAEDFNFTPYVVAGLLFVALTIPLTRLTDFVARRQGWYGGGGGPV